MGGICGIYREMKSRYRILVTMLEEKNPMGDS
jgi:hypothetical protein